MITDARILLMRINIRDRRIFWLTPGGGIQPGESDSGGLTRELFEETGLRDPCLGPLVWRRETRFAAQADHLVGRQYHQFERFYWVDVPRGFEPTIDNMPYEPERDWFTGYRWMSVDDISTLDEEVIPRQLGPELSKLLQLGLPTTPIDIS